MSLSPNVHQPGSVSQGYQNPVYWGPSASGASTPSTSLTPESPASSGVVSVKDWWSRRGSAATTATDSRWSSRRSSLASGSTADAAQIVEWKTDDEEHPWNWSEKSKWLGLCVAILFNSSTAMNAAGYPTTEIAGSEELDVSPVSYLTGSTAYLIPVAIAPLFLAPLSEVAGRRKLCLLTISLYTIMFVPQALTPNFAGIILPRICQGLTGSVGNTMVGGFVADLWPKNGRSLPMSFFVLTVLASQAIGSAVSAWTVANDSLGWRWVFWWQGIVALATCFVMFFLLPETRAEVILSWRAKRLTQETGRLHMTREEQSCPHLMTAIYTNCSRPIIFFFQEPIVAALALWSGFIWGVVFLSLRSVKYTFEVYNLAPHWKSTILLTYAAGALLGFISNFHQSWLYNRSAAKNGGRGRPEVRLIWTMPAAFLTSGGLFWYGWTAQANIPLVVPILGLLSFAWGTYLVYLGALVYLADAYETYSSSAIACQALVRNLTAGILAVVSEPLYTRMEPPVASSVLGAVAAVLGLAPFAIYIYGARLRARSPAAAHLAQQEAEEESRGDKGTGEKQQKEEA